MPRLRGIPPGILLIRNIRGKDWNLKTYRYLILFVTFIAYTAYHASRKPSSIVKSVLDPNPIQTDDSNHVNVLPWPMGDVFVTSNVNETYYHPYESDGWDPFNGKYGTSKLGEIDVAFLAVYSLGMYVAGHLGDTLDLRLFLTTGMIGSGIFVGLFGMGYFWNVHHFWYFLSMQMVAGLFQATGWPSVVAVIGNWFGKRRRGLIMGIWNAHTSVGNISGSLLAASVLDYGWGWSFILPGGFIVVAGIFVFLFLAAYPEDVGFPYPSDSSPNARGAIRDDSVWDEGTSNDEEAPVQRFSSVNRKGVGFVGACFIPGVIPFALCLFFSKLVAYTFLFWLPFYLSQTGTSAHNSVDFICKICWYVVHI